MITRVAAFRFGYMTGLIAALLVASACGEKAPPPPAYSIQAVVDSLLPSVERVSSLQAVGPIKVDTRTTDQVIAFVTSRMTVEFPEAKLEGSRLVYVMLGLLPPNYDLRQQLVAIYAEQIVGFYDPKTKTLYAVESVPPAALKPVLAHELVHALQDQHANLDSLISGDRGSDRQIAAQAAIEGQATLAMLVWASEAATGQPVDPVRIPDVANALRSNFDSQPSSLLARAPRIIRDALIFPYASGASFVQALWRRPATASAAPFDAYLPQSTEQVIEPETRFFLDRDEPTELRFDSIPGWIPRFEDTLGAFGTTIFTEEHAGVYGASGWDGDRLALFDGADSTHILVWTSIWDDAGSADRFASTARQILSMPAFGHPGRVRRDSLEHRPVVEVRIADSLALLDRLPSMSVRCVSPDGAPLVCSATQSGIANEN